FPLSLNHFWDPDTNDHLPLGDTARNRAITFFNQAITDYNSSNPARAYFTLGRVAHLLEDMAQPAHVHLDVHGPFDPLNNYEGVVDDNHTHYVWHAAPSLGDPNDNQKIATFLGGYPLAPVDYSLLPSSIEGAATYNDTSF